MTFVIITHVPHIVENNQYFAYSPYVREMNLWLKYVDKVVIVAPIENSMRNPIHLRYEHENIEFVAIDSFDVMSMKGVLASLIKIPSILYKIYKNIKKGNHIHLRCPGNIGLLGTLVQVLFPNKNKTAKYAGNWDPNVSSPFSYRLQKAILSNTFLTRNMQVLVYGQWEGSTKNIKPFFTATYKENDKKEVEPRILNGIIKFVFVGTLSSGKKPLYALKLIHELHQKGWPVELSVFGEGKERASLELNISDNKLQNYVILHGNQNAEIIQQAYQQSHFVLLPSQSEGWPKVIAEGMFWGCVPLATKVSCVPYMIDYGKRGVLLEIDLETDLNRIQKLMKEEETYQKIAKNGMEWSRKYTLDVFEQEIKLLLQS